VTKGKQGISGGQEGLLTRAGKFEWGREVSEKRERERERDAHVRD